MKSTKKQKETCAAINVCIKRRRECGSSPPLRALAGLTAEARNAGAKPNNKVTTRVSATPNPSTLQSAGRTSRAGWSGGLIIPTTTGADHHANNAPMVAARNATQALSTKTSCTRRHRPAPMETLSAISRDRAAA